MKFKTVLLLAMFFSICASLSWGQTWNLSETMTAVLGGNGTLTISTTEVGGEAMPDFYFISPPYNSTDIPWYHGSRGAIYSVVIENNVTTIGDYAFYDCYNLRDLKIGNLVNTIGKSSFSHCSGLTSVSIPNSVIKIGNGAFSHCYGFTSVAIPNSVMEIEEAAFMSCSKLTSVDVDAENSAYVSDNGVLFSKDSTLLHTYPIGKNATTFTIPASVTTIEYGAFYGSNLSSVTIPDCVTIIRIAAFADCSNLASITIPHSVELIGDYAFRNCTALTGVTVERTTPPWVSSNAFTNVNLSSLMLHVPAGTKKDYEAHHVWGLFGIIDDGTTGSSDQVWQLTPTMTATLDSNGVLTISTTKAEGEAMPNASNMSSMPPWYQVWFDVHSIAFEGNVTTIGDGAFFGCSITSVIVPNTVSSIGFIAFTNSGLTSITIPNSVTSIGIQAFGNCSGLTDVSVEWTTPLPVPDDIFSANTDISAATLHVPAGTKALYAADPVWGAFGTIDDGSTTPDPDPDPILSVSTDSLLFMASEDQATFTITSNTDWIVSSDASWATLSPASGSNNGEITVFVEENTTTTQRTATLTVSGTGVADQTISVTQEAAEPTVIPEETQPVAEDGKGTIELSLSIPSNTTLTGSFEIQFPDGMILDEELTALIPELADNFSLLFTHKGDNTWLIEIKSNALRSASAVEYRKIMDIAYRVDENVAKGTYKATITNLAFILDDDTVIEEDSVPVSIHVERDVTSLDNVRTSFFVSVVDNVLRIESPQQELITVYSLTGVQLHTVMKSAGLIEIPVSSLTGTMFIVKGSVSGTVKIIKS